MKRITLLIVLLVLFSIAFGTNLKGSGNLLETANKTTAYGIAPSDHYKTHDMGQLYMTLCNWGVFGSQRGDATASRCDPFHAYYEICDLSDGACIPSGEYPGCSGVEYLFQGCLWIGATVDGDTLVSIGEDGWFQVREFYASRDLADTMITHTIYDEEFTAGDSSWAQSEQDYLCEFTDTAQDRNFVHEGHRPIGLKVGQRSMSWSYDYAKNIVAIEYYIENIRLDGRTIEDAYIGIYVDGDCGHIDTPDYAQDDVNGFIETYTPAWAPDSVFEINLAWLADNDGDPNGDRRYDERSCPGAMAVKVLYPTPDVRDDIHYAFNWWISNTNEDDYDWGPCRNENFHGWDGTPEDDKMKYEVLSDIEFDYNQSEISDYSAPGGDWITPPSGRAEDLMDGYDTRFLLSFGPFNLEPEEVETLTIGFMVGENFHINPTNYCGPRGSVGSCGSEWNDDGYSYENLADAAIMLQQIYEAGWRGPQPPSAPEMDVVLDPYDVTIYWQSNGVDTLRDPITQLVDFEGYRIYIADWNLEQYYSPLAEFDKINYRRYEKFVYDHLNETTTPWLSNEIVVDSSEYLVPIVDLGGDTLRDSLISTPMPIYENVGMPPETLYKAPWDSVEEMYYYYHIRDIRPGQERYVVVTAFDNGRSVPYLASLESNKKNNALWIVPRGDNDEIKGVYAWPNPYRVDQNYYGQDGLWAEGSPTSTWTEYSRKMHFANLPAKCTIRIFTLDGDVVDILEHDDDEPGSVIGGETWSMINQNDQSIVSGMYIFSVEDHDSGDIETGKFVIIK